MTLARRVAVLLAVPTVLLPPATAPAAAASWSPPATVTSRGAVGFALTAGADGTAAMTWQQDGVRVSVHQPGHGWSAPRRIAGAHALTGRPSVAVTGRGEVVVAWPQSTSPASSRTIRGPITIHARARGTSGNWGTERVLGTTTHFVEARIALAANARGETIAAWRVLRISAHRRTDAVASAFRRPAAAFGGPQLVRDPGEASAGSSAPAVALDAAGAAQLAWTGGSGARVRLATRTRGARGAWRRPRTLSSVPSSLPAVVVSADRSATVAWRAAPADSEGEGIRAGALETRTRSASGALGAAQTATRDAVSAFWLVARTGGGAVLSWAPRSSEAAPGELHVAVKPSPGAPFGAPQVISGVRPDSFHGGLAVLPDGTTLAAAGQDGRGRVFAAAPGTAFGTAPELDTAGSYVLVATGGEHAFAAWATLDGERVGLQASARSRVSR